MQYTELVIGTTPSAIYRQALREVEKNGDMTREQLAEIPKFIRRGHGFCMGREEGLEEGLLRGREEGREEGLLRGREEGREEGLLEATKRGLLDVIALRHLGLDAQSRAQIRACADLPTLERWREQAISCQESAPLSLRERSGRTI